MSSERSLFDQVPFNLDCSGKVVRPPLGVVTIRRVVRAMRGGSQARMVQGDDGLFYICKFYGNPQGNRSLINEVVTYRLMEALGISTPRLCLLDLACSDDPSNEVFFLVGKHRVRPQMGLHLGSACPVNPETNFITDILPCSKLSLITNLDEYGLVYVVDKWLGHVDARQTIFVRDRTMKTSVHFKAWFIDHGYMLGANSWEITDAPDQGLCMPKSVYRMIDMGKLTASAIDQIAQLSPGTLRCMSADIPPEWFGPGDYDCLDALLVRVETRRQELTAIISHHLNGLDI